MMNQQLLFVLVAVAFSCSSAAGDMWTTTSDAKGCKLNAENITSAGVRDQVWSAASCREMCERRGSCIAVDYYRFTNVCIFFNDACTTPQTTADGVSSFRIAREADWAAIDESAACEANEEDVARFGKPIWVFALDECQQACTRRARCVAVDYFQETGLCSFYSEPCKKPLARDSGASSYRITQHKQVPTVVEMKREVLALAKAQHEWSSISLEMGCATNDENIMPLSPGVAARDLSECRQICEEDAICSAVDFYPTKFSEDSYCVLFARPCARPLEQRDGGASWRLVTKPVTWSTISRTKGCETNPDGVQPINIGQRGGARMRSPGHQDESLAECKRRCEARMDCAAVDFFYSTGQCILFNEACITPKAEHDGSSSHLILRTPAVQTETKVQQGSGLSVGREKSFTLRGKGLNFAL